MDICVLVESGWHSHPLFVSRRIRRIAEYDVSVKPIRFFLIRRTGVEDALPRISFILATVKQGKHSAILRILREKKLWIYLGMEQDDRLKKQIDQLGKVLGKILADLLRIKNQGDTSISIDTVFVSFKTELDLDLEEIIDHPVEELIEYLRKEKGFTNSNMEILADILYNLENGSNLSRQFECLERALSIYEYNQLEDSNFSIERMEKIRRIRAFLN